MARGHVHAITAEELIAEAGRNVQGPPAPDAFSPEFLAFAFEDMLRSQLLAIDYEGDRTGPGAYVARLLATMAYQARAVSQGNVVPFPA